MTSAASFSSSLSIPSTLSETLANPKTPWLVSEPVFKRLQPASTSSSYKKCEITNQDPEWDFVHRYFNNQRPHNRSIKRIYCVHNPVITKQFETQIENSEAEAKNPFHAPQWQGQEPVALRRKVHKRWQAITTPFSGFALDERHYDVKQTKLLPLWHGTKEAVCHSICETGFTTFGKHHLASGGSVGAGKVVDMGFFGSGLYFTTSARYAAEIYSDGNLFLAWVSMREPFPVVADKICKPPNEPKDMKLLKGQGHYQGYNAHYIPVISVDPTNPQCAIYFPCAEGQTPVWDEVVVFHKSQTLPRFWLELQVDLLKNPSSPTASVQILLEKVLDLLESDQVKQDQNILSILEKKTEMLLVLNPQEALSAEDQDFLLWTKQLLGQAGKVKKNAKQTLSPLQVGKTELQNTSAPEAAPHTLAEKVDALLAQIDFDSAIEIAEKITDEDEKASALLKIVGALLKQSDFDKAILIAEKITNEDERSRAFIKIALKQGDFDKAIEIAEKISSKSTMFFALLEIFEALFKQGDFDRAILIAEKLEVCKETSLLKIIDALLAQGNIGKAIQVAEKISVFLSTALGRIIPSLVEKCDIDRVILIAEQNPSCFFIPKKIVVAVLEQAGIAKALQVAEQMTDKDEKSSAILEIVKVALKQGDIDKAIEITEKISDEYLRSSALKEVAKHSPSD